MTDPAYDQPYLLINGERVSRDGREGLPVRNPSTGEVLGALPVATLSDLTRAIELASGAFRSWSQVPPLERGKVLKRAAELMRERIDSIAAAITLEQGKPLFEARWEVLWTADVVDWQAEEARRTYGRVLPVATKGRALVVKEPVGPVAAFTPWNLPAFLPARKIATALAAGCSCIIKPAEETPTGALKIAECFLDAGVPPGALSVVFGDPSMISTHLISSPAIRKVSFTGSTKVGTLLAELSVKHIKRMTMELGGHAPTVIFDDVDLDRVIAEAAAYKFMNAGQICIAPTRFYVHEAVHDKFVKNISEAARSLVVGDGMDPATQMGPLSNPRRMDAMERLISDATRQGADLIVGGSRTGNHGYFWQPTVLANVPETATIMNEEPFGPVVVTSSFRDEDDVIARSNRLGYGLAAFAFSGASDRANRLASSIEAGMVGVNTFAVTMPEAPFGGVKDSGYGLEGGTEGIEAYLTTKFVHQV
ncbi:NAD-dependent succinate-semialdehyde dehydrogenase [Paraburkholderia elongata]|uniref:Aldehyde dehydrogenase family protein n=1 Tax=Paraburkholderia elongata TaxID=2675747 RepID=A0A972NIT0_9BURK|nr:NAD-dependent succinate-semialdehyde dehydrogenase [Paraburkholderia elongata]NPT53063.1 aldehyde dehydrogenase family protein [Paraburkholderia elongata]